MGYSHYFYVSEEYDTELFDKVVSDFKRMLQPLKHYDVELAGVNGEGDATITSTQIAFNGKVNCGHEERQLGITWPSKNAAGVFHNDVKSDEKSVIAGSWFGGAQLSQRACGGDCSHEGFSISQKFETELTRYDGTTYTKTSEGERQTFQNAEGKYAKNESQIVGKYFDCVKTAYKPYDLAVNICLIIAKHYFGDNIVVKSDGEINNWEEAMALCDYFLGYGNDFKLDDDEEEELISPEGATTRLVFHTLTNVGKPNQTTETKVVNIDKDGKEVI